LDNWRQGKAANAMGMAQWYLADTPGETGQYVEAGTSTTAPGNANAVRSLGASSMDQNRFPKLLYYVYEAAWTPFTTKPVVHLAGHWNLSSGSVQVNAFSNCPSVELLVNGVQQGSIETPNPWNSNDEGNQTETATQIPFQTSWIVPWVSGTVTAECLNASGTVVATDSRTTAGAENKIVLTVVPELTKPNGTTFQVTANGSDAAFVTATIEDANGNWEPLASDLVTFSVTGPATYQGGTEQYVSTNTNAYSNANSTYIGGVPDAFYHSPGDPELQVEGGMTRIALRSQFTPGTVTVTATAPGLASGSASFAIVPVPDPRSGTASCTAVPSAPTGLTATAASSNVISLAWTAVNPPANCAISFYNTYRSTTSGFTPSSTTLVASGVTTASYSDTGLAGSTTYYYKVEAVDADGTSAASAQASATTPVTPVCTTVPSAPTGLTATASSSSVIGLSWTAVTPPANCTISSYSVYGGTIANPTTLLASGLTGTTYSNTGLAASTTYYYVAKAVDGDGTSAASAQALATTPAASSGTSVVSIDTGGAAVSNSGGGDNSFVADEDFIGGGTYSATNTISIPASVTTAAPAAVYQSARQGASTYTIPGLTAGTSYTVRLHFAELYFSAAGDREFDVAINGTTVLTNFDIYATAKANFTAVVEQFAATANSSGQIVIAFTNGAIDQPMINGVEVLGSSTSCSTVPSAPTGLAATASSSSAIGLSWSAVTPPANCAISSYNVYGGTTANPTTLIASGLTGTTYSNTGLAASTMYYYVVKAVDADGTSAASAQASATTSAAPSCTSVPPTGPTGLTATASSSSDISLSWTAAPANPPCTITSYSVYRSTVNGFTPSPSTLDASGVTATSYSDTGLTASTTYYYVVEAFDSFGASAASAQATATTPAASSGTSIVSINAGGPAESNSGGGDNSFVADEDYSAGGTTYSVTNSITIPASVTNAAPAAVYQSARQGAITYTIPGLTDGASYTVRLHFAELYFSAAGQRVFNVAINGTTVLSNFDIYATAKANFTAVVEQFAATANSGGDIVIAFTNGTIDQPMIEGVEVLGSSTSCTTVPSAPTGLTGTASSPSAIGLSWSAVTPPANCTISSYSVYGGTTANPTTLLASGLTGTTYSNTGLAASTTYYYVVKAADADGISAASAQATATTPAVSGAEILAIAAGGPAESNSGGGDYSFVADEDFNGGGDNAITSATINLTQPGANVAPMAVYQHGRAGIFTYSIPGLTAGTQYTVLLHFAETYFTGAGDRVFNVAINGTTVLSSFDIYATVGVNAALVEQFMATANSSGQIVIAFTDGAANQPVVSGIEIR
jgi:fibronectin type 3 domain-containing protein